MRKFKRVLAIFFLSLSVIFASSFAYSNSEFTQQISNAMDMEKLIKDNSRCIRCHKVERKLKSIPAMTMQGAHASTTFYDNCTACHGDKGKHPKVDATIINFSTPSTTPIDKQNKQCIACHTPTALRQAEWTHDVHYKKISCATCHQLHSAVDPIINIKRKTRIKLCVDCHASASESKGAQ